MTALAVTEGIGRAQGVQLDRAQQTLAGAVSIDGTGLHTGEIASMRILPASEGTGILFRRTDLPGAPEIPALASYVHATPRSTILANEDGVRVHTTEHVLAALAGMGINNAIIELAQEEPPIADGSALPFIEAIEKVGVTSQDSPVEALEVLEPIHLSVGEIHLVILPHDGFKVSYTLHHPAGSPLIQCQYVSIEIGPESFKKEIAPCRTFCQRHEVEALQAQGLIKGGNLDNALVFDGDQVLSTEKQRFPDEPARHKILDLLGDLALVGRPLLGHVIAIRSGHTTNVQLAQEIAKEKTV